MSERLSDSEMAGLRDHLRTERERNLGRPTLTWEEVDALLDEVLEARRKITILEGRAVEYLSTEDEKGRRIAELEEEREAREAQLAEMRKEIEDAALAPLPTTRDSITAMGKILCALDRYAIPTTPPEAEEDDA